VFSSWEPRDGGVYGFYGPRGCPQNGWFIDVYRWFIMDNPIGLMIWWANLNGMMEMDDLSWDTHTCNTSPEFESQLQGTIPF
jgi:hypothetical protein